MNKHHLVVNSAQALKILKAGNQRYINEKFAKQHLDQQRRLDIAPHQYPFAAVLGCSDSRVPPEIIFDQGLGDIFVSRTAGHVLDDSVLGSLEYGVQNLEISLIIVLGHYNCGAVAAAVSEKNDFPSHIAHLIASIKPAVQKAKEMTGDLLKNAITCNVELVVEQLFSRSPILSTAVKNNKLQIIGAIYDINSGKVDLP